MLEGRWFLTVEPAESDKVKTHWMDEEDLEKFGIEGKIGEEYLVFDGEPETKRCIVGEIKGQAAEVLNSVVSMIETAGGDSQALRFEIINELVQDVARAVVRRVLP